MVKKKITTDKDLHKDISTILYCLAALLLILGSSMALDDWYKNKLTSDYAKNQVSLANRGLPSTAPATTKPPVQVVDNYTVPPEMPRYLLIPKISVKSRVYPVGINKSGAIGVPGNVHDVAWFNQSSLPGNKGTSLIDGHVSSWTANGVFYDLKKLRVGDEVLVQKGNGTILHYKVSKSQVYDAKTIDMNSILNSSSNSSALDLITCTGSVVAGTNEFSQRLVVFTVLQ